MSDLNTKYVINLDLVEECNNPIMCFSLSDVETCDFYVNLTNKKAIIFDKDLKVTMRILRPSRNDTEIDLIPNEEGDNYYCNLPLEHRNLIGKYKAQIIVYDDETKETKSTKSFFTYTVQKDILAESTEITEDEEHELFQRIESLEEKISQMNGIIDTPPTYVKPTLSLSCSKTSIQHNVATSITLTPNFTKNDGGNITSYSLAKNGTIVYSGTQTKPYTDNITLSHGSSITYTATIGYADGEIKNTTMGVPYPSTSIKAGTVSSNSSVKAYASSYYGVIDGNTISESDISTLSSRIGSSKSYTYTTSLTNQRIVYMYPKSFGTLTSIKDANNFDYINSYTRSEMTYDGVDYYVYILTDEVTITNFKQAFS